MPVFGREVEQGRCSVVLFSLGELTHEIPCVLRGHLTVVFPFDAGEIGSRHWEGVLEA